MTTQHNPSRGEWKLCIGPYGPYITAQSKGQDIVIAKLHWCMTPDVSEEESKANGTLIAAVPDLLAAVESAHIALMHPGSDTWRKTALIDIEHALAKSDIPIDVIEAARKVSLWMEQNGHEDWIIGGVQSAKWR